MRSRSQFSVTLFNSHFCSLIDPAVTESYGDSPLASTMPSSCMPVLGSFVSGEEDVKRSNMTLHGKRGDELMTVAIFQPLPAKHGRRNESQIHTVCYLDDGCSSCFQDSTSVLMISKLFWRTLLLSWGQCSIRKFNSRLAR